METPPQGQRRPPPDNVVVLRPIRKSGRLLHILQSSEFQGEPHTPILKDISLQDQLPFAPKH
jgi:hypothetical protein